MQPDNVSSADNKPISTFEAALKLGMTPEGVRKLCQRSNFGERDTQGRWVLTASEVEEIRRARAIVWGDTQ